MGSARVLGRPSLPLRSATGILSFTDSIFASDGQRAGGAVHGGHEGSDGYALWPESSLPAAEDQTAEGRADRQIEKQELEGRREDTVRAQTGEA